MQLRFYDEVVFIKFFFVKRSGLKQKATSKGDLMPNANLFHFSLFGLDVHT